MKEGLGLIAIISTVLNNQKRVSFDDLDFTKLFQLAKFHSVENFLYYGLHVNDQKNQQILVKEHQSSVLKSAYQDAEQEQISNLLEENKIKHLFLKGSVLKTLYPSLDLRSMADLDILVDKNSLKSLTPLMKKIGYQVERLGGNHDVYYKPPFMNIEFHRQMIDESYAMSRYYQNIWDKVQLVANKNYAYELNKDDFYIYMIAHAAKHYQNGGTGIRSVIDVYIYLQQFKSQLNWDYLEKEFRKLKIFEFAENLQKLSQVWFSNEVADESINLIGDYIINSGTYGTFAHSMMLKESNKRHMIFKRAFPGYKTMVKLFPILKYIPILLPFFWIFRLFKAIIIKPKTIKQQMSIIKNINSDDVKKIDELKSKSGIEVENENS